MDIRSALAKSHSKTTTLKIVKYIGDDVEKFRALVDIFLEGPYRITQRAAWPLSVCVESHPQLIQPHLNKILKFAGTPGIHDAVKRNTVRLLQFIDLPPKFQGKVADLCFRFLSEKAQPIAVRAFSLTVLSKIATAQKALQHELRIVIEDQLPYASPAFSARAKKVLHQLQKDTAA